MRLAPHVVLERLSPAERTAFVLHDVFQLSFDDVAEVVGRSPAACRQLASRARRHVADGAGPGRFAVETAEQRQLTETFIRASTTGDLDALLGVLDPEVAGQADLGGVIGLLPPVTGRDEVAANLLRFLGPDAGVTLVSLPTGGGPCVVAIRDRHVAVLVTLTIRDGVIHHLHAVVDPREVARADADLQP